MSHSKKIARLGMLSAACATLLALAMPASASQVLLRADLHGTDFIDWGVALGRDGSTFAGPKAITTHVGLDAEVDVVDGLLTRQNQGTSWFGNFAPGARLLSAGKVFPEGPISITFVDGLSAIGAQIETRAYSPPDFDGVIAVYDQFSHLLETYTRKGHSVNFADDSAIFLGVARSTADIFRVDFNIGVPFFEFSINQVDLIAGVATPPLPEPSGLSLLGLALLGVALLRRRLPG